MPGHSTDATAAMLARTYDAKIINISNISHVYDKDPELEGATPLSEITYDQMLTMTGERWSPGANIPFDPTATKIARDENIPVHFIDADMSKLKAIFDGTDVDGTIMRNHTSQ